MNENDLEVFDKLSAIATPQFAMTFGDNSERAIQIAEHRNWFSSIRHERPATNKEYKIGVYIRYFNQTKYDNYLAYHKKQFVDTIALCPKWTLVDFYIDEGSTAPNMESAPEWSRLLCDAMENRVDLIITQKVSNVSKKIHEVTMCARLLAGQKNPIGIYFISEDIFTLASYYREDLRDPFFFPTPDWKTLPDDNEGNGVALWCSTQKGKRKPKPITCKLFFAKIVALMGWNPDYRYKMLGKVVHANGMYLLAFDLTSAETYQRTVKEGESPKYSKKPIFPTEWQDQFGLPYNEHKQSLQINTFDGYAIIAVKENVVEEGRETATSHALEAVGKSMV